MGVRFFCGFENNVVILQAQIQQQELLIITLLRKTNDSFIKTNGFFMKTNVYFCPSCGNVGVAYGKASMECCGESVLPVEVRLCQNAPMVTQMDGEYLLEFDSPMTKENYIAAVVVERYDRVELIRLFAEQEGRVRVAEIRGARIIVVYRQQDKIWGEEYKASIAPKGATN